MMVGGAVPAQQQKQPPGLFLLFGVEMWERFSFYGMKALLIFYLIDTQRGGMGWPRATAARLFGLYGLLVYVAPVLGGYLADRVLGTHRAMVIGGVIIACGHFCLAIPATPTFFLGLILIVIGTGFFKANVSTMVGQLYEERDIRRDAGFTIFYMGVNAGGFLGPIVCGYLADNPRWGWHYAFGAAGVGMVLGLLLYLRYKQRFLPGIGLRPHRERADRKETTAGGAGPPALTREERDRIAALFIVFFLVIFFWAPFEQTGSSMNLFAAERTDRVISGFRFPAAWFQSVNSLAILILAPVFAALWTSLARRGREPSTPIKMAIAMLLLGAGFVFMVIGARRSDGGALVSPLWLVGAYVLHTCGELCLSPVGLSMVTKLAPLKYVSFFMGLWFVFTGVAEFIAGQLAAVTEKIARGEVFHLLGGQADFFLIFVASSAVAGIALFVLTPTIKRLTHGREA